MCGGLRAVTAANPALMFMTSKETAAMLRVSSRTLERMRVEGNGPRYLKVGASKRARVLYRQTDVEGWLNEFVFGSTSEYSNKKGP